MTDSLKLAATPGRATSDSRRNPSMCLPVRRQWAIDVPAPTPYEPEGEPLPEPEPAPGVQPEREPVWP
jgi:hypothetical protein